MFFAPRHDRQQSASYWETLFRATIRAFYAIASQPRRNAAAWDRLTLELMLIANLGPNWDREGAEPISPTSVRTAAILLQFARVAAESSDVVHPLPLLVPSVEGGITLKWIRAEKELKCTVNGESVEVVRWGSAEAYESQGLWELPVKRVPEHFAWLLQ
jgi:hypothetical protein